MKDINNYQVEVMDASELQKIEGGLLVSSKILKGLAFAAGFVVGFIGELAEE